MAQTSAAFIGGVDLGGTKILSIVVDGDMRVLKSDQRPTEAERGPEAVIGRMVASMRAAARGRSLRAVGISTPGPCDPDRGIVTSPPNLPGWRDVPLARRVSERLGVPAWIENDANAAAIAEHRLGAGRGSSHLVLVALGTGIGGGFVFGGKLYRGVSGAAGEIGHMQLVPGGRRCGCGRRGCLEALASGRALGEIAAEIIEREPDGILAHIAGYSSATAQHLLEAADAGDESAATAIDEAGSHLGAGLANLIDLLNPEVIVIAGNLRKLGDRYLGPAMALARHEAFAQSVAGVRIVEAGLGDDAAAIGAAIVAADRLAGA